MKAPDNNSDDCNDSVSEDSDEDEENVVTKPASTEQRVHQMLIERCQAIKQVLAVISFVIYIK